MKQGCVCAFLVRILGVLGAQAVRARVLAEARKREAENDERKRKAEAEAAAEAEANERLKRDLKVPSLLLTLSPLTNVPVLYPSTFASSGAL